MTKLSIEARARLLFALVVILGVAAGLAWYMYESGRYATYQIRTEDSVSGLIVDSPVEFHGVEIGKVARIELIDHTTVGILLDIRKDAPITYATVATITARGLAARGFTGYVYVSLEDSGTDLRPLAAPPDSPFPVIRSAPSRWVNVDSSISQVQENVQLIVDILQSVLDRKTIASLKQSLESLDQVTRTLAANNAKLASILANTEQASNQFKPLLESSNDSVKALQTQILPEFYKSISNLNNLSGSLSRVADKVDRDPSILLRGSKTPPGPGERR